MPNKPGRPKLDAAKARTKIITLRLTEEEYSEILFGTPAGERSMSDWIRKVLLSAVRGGIGIT